MTGIEAFLEILAAAGVTHIFGNPGTTELPLNDALVKDDRFRYMFGLHEIPVMAAADGYALASGKLGVVNVHISCGLGNAMGMLYNAYCEGTPLLLTAGQQDRRFGLEEPVLDADTVRVAQPWTKWAYEVTRSDDVPAATRRAIQTALTPPTGPVFLSLPLDLQMEKRDFADLSPPCIPSRRVRPPYEDLMRASEILSRAKKPLILAGSRVAEADGVAELVAVAELLGAEVLAESHSAHARLPFPCDHPLYAGMLPLWSAEVHERFAKHDVLLVIGVNFLRQYIYHEPNRPVPDHVKIVQIDNEPRQLNKNYPAEVALLGDPKAALGELAELLNKTANSERNAAAKQRIEQASATRQAERESLLGAADDERGQRPMTPLTLMTTLAKVLPPNIAVVQEAITAGVETLEKLGAIKDSTGYFGHRGWALGWGLGCSLGVKLAWPDRPILCLLGEGSALYGIQGLWTAAHYNIPVTFVICNNAQYKILKVCADVLPLEQMSKKNFLGMDLIQPEIDILNLARSFGVEAHRIDEPDELAERVREALATDRPCLFDVPMQR